MVVNQGLCGAVSQPLRHFNGIMDRHKHPEILDLLDFLGRGFIYQENNDPKHRSHDVLEWIQRHRITRHDWPNQSPNLNIIEFDLLSPKTFVFLNTDCISCKISLPANCWASYFDSTFYRILDKQNKFPESLYLFIVPIVSVTKNLITYV